MKFSFILTVFPAFLFTLSYSQPSFQKVYFYPKTAEGLTAGYGVSMIELMPDSGYLIGGYRGTGMESSNNFFLRLDKWGDTLWSKNILNEAWASHILYLQNGEFLFTGTYSISWINWTAGAMIIGVNSSFDTLWTNLIKVPPMVQQKHYQGESSCEVMAGGFLSVGTTNYFGAGSNDIFLFRTNANGNILWKKSYGGSGDEYGYLVREIPSGSGYFVAGAMGWDIILMRTDIAGNIQWAKTYGTPDGEEPVDILFPDDSSVVVLGIKGYLFGNGKMVLFKTDMSGNLFFYKEFQFSASIIGNRVIKHNNGYIITGAVRDSTNITKLLLAKTDGSGNIMWAMQVRDTFSISGDIVSTTLDGELIIGGHVSRPYGNSPATNLPVLIKTDTAGNAFCNQLPINLSITSPVDSGLPASLTTMTGGDTTRGIYYNKIASHLASRDLCIPPLFLNLDSIRNVMCKDDSSGFIDIEVTGGISPYSYLFVKWSNPVDTINDLYDLPVGTYNVSVNDSGFWPLNKFYTITAQDPVINITTTIVDTATSGNNDGSIDITVTGGTQPFTFFWSNGAMTEDIDSLTAGTYTVTVSDSLGCEKTDTFVVPLTYGIGEADFTADEEVLVFSYPENETIVVIFKNFDLGSADWKIFNITGALTLSGNIIINSSNHFLPLQVNYMAKGLYYLQIISSNKIITKKINTL